MKRAVTQDEVPGQDFVPMDEEHQIAGDTQPSSSISADEISRHPDQHQVFQSQSYQEQHVQELALVRKTSDKRSRLCKPSRSFRSSNSGATCSRCNARIQRKKKQDDVDDDDSEQGEEEEDPEDEEYEELIMRSHKRDKIELGRSFQQAVSAHSWDLAESYILRADTQRLNDGLCIALDSVWFLSTQEELSGAMRLIEKIIQAGANDYTRATLRTSFLASCVSACRSRTMSLADTVTVMAQRLRDRLQECNGDEDQKAEAAAKVQRFTEWALRCIGSHSRSSSKSHYNNRIIQNSTTESCLQLMAFKRFLHMAGDNLSGKDYTEAFDAACFPLTLFSSAIDPGWATGIAASAMQGLLAMLLEGGADNANQCFLEAARFGSTELVRILLQIAKRAGAELDVDLALGFASHYGKLGTMECLVSEGHAGAFLGPLMRAAERGSLEVVEWFVRRGCVDMELCLALTAAASSSRIHVASYLLAHVPGHVLEALSAEILKAAGERSAGGSLQGIAFLLHADFLGDADATYHLADGIATSADDEGVTDELRAFLWREWSEEAFAAGRLVGAKHHLNFVRVLRRGCSPLCLHELPVPLQATVAYLPLYKECVACQGVLLTQRLRGQLVEAVSRLQVGVPEAELLRWSKKRLLAVLGTRLPPAFLM